jgi:hypothetical protein
MRYIELIATIDERHHLHADVPPDVPIGPVHLLVLVPEEDDAGAAWTEGIASAWARELDDPNEDIYTVDDGRPVR